MSTGGTARAGAERWWAQLRNGDARALWSLAVCAALAFVSLYAVAVWTRPGQWVDAQGFARVHRLFPGPVSPLLAFLARDVFPVLLAVLTGVLGVLDLIRRAWRSLVPAILVVVVSVPLAWWLRSRVLPVPGAAKDLRVYATNTFPSTHMAAVAALMAAALLLWPGKPGRSVLNTAAVTLVLCFVGNFVGLAHVPSDPLGSVLLVVAVTATLLAMLRPCALDRGPTTRP